MNDELPQFILRHAVRGACRCGQCLDRVPDAPQPPGPHTVNVGFFEVCARDDPQADALRRLMEEHPGEFTLCDPLDGEPHDFTELGAWLGDQALALMLIGLGTLLGLWACSVINDSVFILPLRLPHEPGKN